MNALILLRHSLTRANEQRLYGGSTDIPLSPAGRDIAEGLRNERPLPDCALYVTSGMQRASETLELLTGRPADFTLSGLREMDFGAFEMKSYEQLKDDPDYIRWISDEAGRIPCPGGESTGAFHQRVLEAGNALIIRPEDSALVVCHGGAIVCLMQNWFPAIQRNFYEWQPKACRGYAIRIKDGRPMGFEEI